MGGGGRRGQNFDRDRDRNERDDRNDRYDRNDSGNQTRGGGYLAVQLTKERARTDRLEDIIESKERHEAVKETAAMVSGAVTDAIRTAIGLPAAAARSTPSSSDKECKPPSEFMHFVKGMRRLLRRKSSATDSQASSSSSSSADKKHKNKKKAKKNSKNPKKQSTTSSAASSSFWNLLTAGNVQNSGGGKKKKKDKDKKKSSKSTKKKGKRKHSSDSSESSSSSAPSMRGTTGTPALAAAAAAAAATLAGHSPATGTPRKLRGIVKRETAWSEEIHGQVAAELAPGEDTTEWPHTHEGWCQTLADKTSLQDINKLIDANSIPRINSNAKQDKLCSIVQWLINSAG